MNSELIDFTEALIHGFCDDFYHDDSVLHEATSYALKAKGKRVRAQLCLLACKAMGGSQKDGARAALAVEMIHAYSLVHDDLPCLDNDDLRRGQPTTHVKYGDDFALLAGDALLTDAFQVLAGVEFGVLGSKLARPSSEQVQKFTAELASAAGGRGMVAGQSSDVYWTAKKGGSLEVLQEIHQRKTAYLMAAACSMGAISAGANPGDVGKLKEFGMNLGMAFQVIDDLIDGEAGIGKTPGKDAESGKLTYVSLLGREKAEELAKKYTQTAKALLESIGEKSEGLSQLTEWLLNRKY